MGLLQQTQQQYYDVKKPFTGDGTTVIFTVSNSNNTFPSSFDESNVDVYIDNILIIPNSYTFSWDPSTMVGMLTLTPQQVQVLHMERPQMAQL